MVTLLSRYRIPILLLTGFFLFTTMPRSADAEEGTAFVLLDKVEEFEPRSGEKALGNRVRIYKSDLLVALWGEATDTDRTFEEADFWFDIPEPVGDHLCIKTYTADGNYYGKHSYSVERATARFEPLLFASENRDFLNRYKLHQFRPLAVLAPQCVDGILEPLVPALPETIDAEKSIEALKVLLRLSGGRPEATVYPRGTGDSDIKWRNCPKQSFTIGTHLCTVTGDALCRGDCTLEIRVWHQDFPDRFKRYPYRILTGSPRQ